MSLRGLQRRLFLAGLCVRLAVLVGVIDSSRR